MQSNNNKDITNIKTVEKTVNQEEKIKVEIMKSIMSEQKTTWPSLRKQNLKTVKAETEIIND